MKSIGLYIHIPFCIKKCNYCDFLSFDYKDEETQQAYIDALIEEIKQAKGRGYSVDSIFIGGGTPSLIDTNSISRVLNEIYLVFNVELDAEITIESNPKTLSSEKLLAYQRMGINRLSIGAQSLNNELLGVLGRSHSSEDFINNYLEARDSGFDNINIDLMFAIPGQTMANWADTLEQTLELKPEHISFYSLQLEEGTRFYDMFKEGKLDYIDDDTDRQMYHHAITMIKEHGYWHYEISNASKPGFECRHNLKYWSMGDYLGLGLGAHSYLEGWRFRNQGDINTYINKIYRPKEIYQNRREDDICEYIITGMRKIGGISLKDFENRYGVSFHHLYESIMGKHLNDGLLELDRDYLKFTAKGIDVSNKVLVDFV